MKAYDFEYDGKNLSDMGYTICKFDYSGGFETVTSGSQITFNTLPILHGAKAELLSTTYEECLGATFEICKDSCVYEEMEITNMEMRQLMKWLNRKEFHKFKLLDMDYIDLYFEGSFNISEIINEDKIYGLELNLITNRPWALMEPKPIDINITEPNGEYSITDVSDEEGFIYPHMEIKLTQGGDLNIHNALEDRTMTIKGCSEGEIITLDYPVIQTSVPSHQIQNDFNWIFFRIANTFRTSKNDITISLPCEIRIVYSPIIKLGF